MMKSQMYPNKQYLGSHLNPGYIGTERKFESYPKIEQNGLDTTSYYKSQKIQRSDFIGSNNFKDNSSWKGRKRNKYKMLPTDIKHKAVELAQNRGAKYSAMFYSVPLKSLKRWMKVGCERKKGGGRKTKDPLMEKNLYNWYREKKNRGENITAKMIKERAIELTNCSDFIASKGWLDKFKVRFNLEISKESSKDYNKRRSLNDSSIKRDEIEGIIRKGYNDDIDHYKSYRRSLNKSLHPELKTVGNRFQNEDSKRITYDGNNSLKTPQKSKNVYNEDLTGVNNNRKKLKNENLSSLFPSIQNDNQFKKSKRIEKSSNNIINLPLCDLMQSEEEYS